jgi:hypothetical protein
MGYRVNLCSSKFWIYYQRVHSCVVDLDLVLSSAEIDIAFAGWVVCAADKARLLFEAASVLTAHPA